MFPDIMLKTRIIRIMMMMMVKMMMKQRKGGETAKKTKTRQLSLAAKSRVDPLLNPVAPKSI